MQPFLASSPPAWDAPGTPQHRASPLSIARENVTSTGTKGKAGTEDMNPKDQIAVSSKAPESKDNHVSKIGILASSMPFYHNQFMEQRKKLRQQEQNGNIAGKVDVAPPNDVPHIDHLSLDGQPRLQSPEEQAETLRRLKPVSLSSLGLQNMAAQPLTQVNTGEPPKADVKKSRTRWQFGIRSRNLPHEAMHCVYKALLGQGAEWEVPGIPDDADFSHSSYPVYVSGATRLTETIDPSRAPSPEIGRHQNKSRSASYEAQHRDRRNRGRPGMGHDFDETEDEDVDSTLR